MLMLPVPTYLYFPVNVREIKEIRHGVTSSPLFDTSCRDKRCITIIYGYDFVLKQLPIECKYKKLQHSSQFNYSQIFSYSYICKIRTIYLHVVLTEDTANSWKELLQNMVSCGVRLPYDVRLDAWLMKEYSMFTSKSK